MTEIKVFLVEVDGCGWGQKGGILLSGGSSEWRREWGGQVRLKRERSLKLDMEDGDAAGSVRLMLETEMIGWT